MLLHRRLHELLSSLIFSMTFPLLFSVTHGQAALDTGMHYVRINGFKANYYVRGRGPVCICPTPGWGPDYWLYTSAFKPLESYFTLVYFDTRGTGLSEAPNDSNYYRYYFPGDLEALRKHLDQKKIWLLGHSAAGTQILRYAALHGKKVNGVIAVAPYWGNIATPDPPDTAYINRFLANLEKRKSYADYELARGIFTGSARVDFATSIRAVFPFYFHDTANMKVLRAASPPQGGVDERPGKHDASIVAPYTTYNSNADYENVPRIMAPVLLIGGDDDVICDPAICASRIHALIKSSELSIIPGAGHFVWIEQPSAFWTSVKEFLSRHQIAAAAP